MNYIIQGLSNASDFFYRIYLEVYSWVYPFWLAAEWFLDLAYLFSDLTWDFYYFSEWVDETHSRLRDILSWDTIRSFILSWLPNLEDISYWFYYWWDFVRQNVEDWWHSTSLIVQSWIDIAKQFLQDQINSLNTWLGSLQLAWDNFKERIPSIDEVLSWFTNWRDNILANIIAWGYLTAGEIDNFLSSKFLEWSPFWEGWLEWKSQIIEFIQDPQGWFYDRLEEVFDRFW